MPAPPLMAVRQFISPSISTVVEGTQIQELPLATRNIYSLFLLPGQRGLARVWRPCTQQALLFRLMATGFRRATIILDGVDNNDIRIAGPVVISSNEGRIQEFRMVASNASAESGRATECVAGLQRPPRERRCTHGNVFSFFSDDAVSARTPLGFEGSGTARCRFSTTANRRVHEAEFMMRNRLFRIRECGGLPVAIRKLHQGYRLADVRVNRSDSQPVRRYC